MNEAAIFDKINSLLEETDYPMEINDISDLEEFLNDEDNSSYDVYPAIEKLYDQLMEGEELDD